MTPDDMIPLSDLRPGDTFRSYLGLEIYQGRLPDGRHDVFYPGLGRRFIPSDARIHRSSVRFAESSKPTN